MNKICFDKNNKIIGFDIENAKFFINIHDINNVKKEVKEIRREQCLDFLGREIYNAVDEFGRTHQTVYIDNKKYTYEPLVKDIKINRTVDLISESNYFTVSDIVEEKRKQLINMYNAKECKVYELISDELDIENCFVGKNIINCINNQLVQLKLSDISYNQLMIYIESDNNEYSMSLQNNSKIDKKVFNKEYVEYFEKDAVLKIQPKNSLKIFSFAILLK